ncbi:MAG: rhomboid family intramembrane serine protease [Pseudorhodobacter sp.]
MFPIRDHNPSGRTPYVNYALILLNVAIFALGWLLFPGPDGQWVLYSQWGLVPNRLMAGGGVETLLTSMFLHGGLMHLAGNMLFLWIFGDNLEDMLGHIRYLFFYLVSGLGAGALQIIEDPASNIPMVGASGAIAGVMGAYLLLFPKARVDVLLIIVIFFRIFPIPAWLVLGFWLGFQIVNSSLLGGGGDGVAYMAHIGGFFAGLLLILPLWLFRGGPAFWRRTHGVPPHPEAQYKYRRSRIPPTRRR